MGLPRSGMTALTWAFNQHPVCVLLWETHFPLLFRDACSPPCGLSDGACEVEWHLGNKAATGHWTLPLLLSPEHGGQGLRREREADVLPDVVRALCTGVRSLWPEAQVFGDKSPLYAFHWEWLRELWPDCRIIIMERDAEDAAKSASRVWYRAYDECLYDVVEHARRLADVPDALRLQWQDLQDDPKRVIDAALEYLGLSLDGYPMESALAELANRRIN